MKKIVLFLLVYLSVIYYIFSVDEEILKTLESRLPAPTNSVAFFDETYKFYPDSKPNLNFADLNNPWLCLKAIQFSYKEVSAVMYDSTVKDWFIEINGTRLYWANGRLLKIEDIQNYEEYNPIIQYYYKKELFDPQDLTYDEMERMKLVNILAKNKNKKKENYTFYEQIYGEFNKEIIFSKLGEVDVFGSIAYMHERVVPSVNKAVNEMQKKLEDPEMKIFLSNYRESYGFNWRLIADSGNISNHSWGIAIDLMAKDYKNQKVYWFWEASTKEYWMMFLPNERWKPANVVIEAFEQVGFIWGGYWDIWDTMHFEYKPELIYITNFFSSPEPHKFREEKNYEQIFEDEKDIFFIKTLIAKNKLE